MIYKIVMKGYNGKYLVITLMVISKQNHHE
jgi:hypothetical protein